MFTAPVAVHLFLRKEGKILLLRRRNTGYEDGNYSVIAGHVDGGEELKAAMTRESREEAGIEVSSSELRVVGVMHRSADREYIDFFLETSNWSRDVKNMEPDKCDDLRWFPVDSLPDNTIPYIRTAIENYLSDIWFGSVGW